MITGFNTDVEHNGIVYHVQTEDKGLDSPIILSLVYVGGAILASKRAPYGDLIAAGFNEEALSERLKRQHRLICAAILAGRLEDLKKMSTPAATRASGQPVAPVEELEFTSTPEDYELLLAKGSFGESEAVQVEQPPAQTLPPPDEPVTKRAKAESPRPSARPNNSEVSRTDDQASGRQSPLGDIPATEQGLVVTLLDDCDFRSGDSVTVRVLVQQRAGDEEKPLANVAVSLKVLGTTFRPQIYSTKTQRDGVASVPTRIPQFTSGRAAILVRVVAQGKSTEIRRVVHPAQ